MYCKIFISILILLSFCKRAHCWSGILLDGNINGTQIYLQSGETQSVQLNIQNERSGLRVAAVMLNNRVHFMNKQSHTIFDPSTNTTTPGSNMNGRRQDHVATVVDDKIIICGGNNDEQSASCEKYIPETEQWSVIDSKGLPVTSMAMTILHNRAYIFGGFGGWFYPDDSADQIPIYLSTTFMYNGERWIRRRSMPVKLAMHSAVALDRDRAVICGGYEISTSPLKECYVYDSNDDTWSKAPAMTQPRYGHSMVVYKGRRNELSFGNWLYKQLQIVFISLVDTIMLMGC